MTLETALRLKGSDRIAELLEKYVELKKTPANYLMNHISQVRQLPDRIYVLMRENWPSKGFISKSIRTFDKPTFKKT